MSDLELLTKQQVTALVKVNASTLWRWMRQGKFPQPAFQERRFVRWRRSDIAAWMTPINSRLTNRPQYSATRRNALQQ